MRRYVLLMALLVVISAIAGAVSTRDADRTLDGNGNNVTGCRKRPRQARADVNEG